MAFLTWSAMFAALVAISLIRAVRQFHCYENLPAEVAVASSDLPSLTVIVPMRNEESNIDACLRALAAQDYPRERLEIIVVDDNSSDRSGDIVRWHAAAERRLRLLNAGPLPAGWAGKPHACWRGALAARTDWLCFLDADTIAAPALLKAAATVMRDRALDMLSLAPFQELHFFFDRLLIPLGFLSIAATQDLARVNSARSRDATANGQCIIVRARSYFAVGGHGAVRQEICEDAALARRIKVARGRFALLGAEQLIRTRMYRSRRELWEGLSKNITEVYGGPAATLATAAAVLFAGWSALLLPATTSAGVIVAPQPLSVAAVTLAILADATFFATTIAVARRLKIHWWYGLLAPLAATIGAVIAVNGVLLRARGRVAWKGRIYTRSRQTPVGSAWPRI